jgi:hypothetical protein
MYYVYVYERKDGTSYYVGKGKDGRAYAPHRRKIREGVYIELKPEDSNRIKILKYFEREGDALDYEASLIETLPNLRNILEGGKQPPSQLGAKRSEQTKQLLSEKKKEYFKTQPGTMTGKKLKDSQIKKISYKVLTPIGVFLSSTKAAVALKISQQTVINRCKSKKEKFVDYKILEVGSKYL